MPVRKIARPLGGVMVFTLVVFLIQVCLPACAAASFPLRAKQCLANLRLDPEPDKPRLPILGSGNDEDMGGDSGGEPPAGDGSGRNTKIIGSSLLVSGVFLCSWGISAWEMEEYQCCPARNTGNVIKIVAGVVLINAGLMYLLGVAD